MMAETITLSKVSKRALAAALAIALCACGGGGGSSSSGGSPTSGATPTPSPTPTPTPTPTAPAFGTLGQVTDQTFATLAYSFLANAGPMDDIPVRGTETTSANVDMRLVAPSSLVLTGDEIGPGTLAPSGGSCSSGGQVTCLSYKLGDNTVWINLVYMDGGSYLKSVAIGSFGVPDKTGKAGRRNTSFMYGVPTKAAALPTAGIQTFRISSLYMAKASDLTVDFSARTVSGSFEIQSTPTPRAYTFSNVKIAADGTFAGNLVAGDPSLNGTISGRFAGEAGDEMMLRYVIPSGADLPDYVLAIGLWGARRIG